MWASGTRSCSNTLQVDRSQAVRFRSRKNEGSAGVPQHIRTHLLLQQQVDGAEDVAPACIQGGLQLQQQHMRRHAEGQDAVRVAIAAAAHESHVSTQRGRTL